MRLFTDIPVASVQEDKFGFAPYVHVLKDTILQTTPLPFCIGIFGAWGSGKSSFMKMLQGLVDGLADVKTIWFNPWKYDKKEDLWNALIQTILYSIAKESEDSEVKRKAKALALATTWLALKKAITAISAGVITEGNMDDIVKSFSNRDELYYQHINQFEKDFAEVVNRYAKGGKLIVFIDDLDRCLPENAIIVLESLKLFIADVNCIFVLGIDNNIIEEGIRYRYGGTVTINGREYLEKIIQVPFFLPSISYEKLKASLLKDGDSKALTEEIWNIIRLGMDGNPRRTKRFVNSFYLSQRFFDPPDQALQKRLQEGSFPALSQEVQDTYLAKILVFRMRFPDFYQHLQLYPGDWEYLDRFVIQEEDAEKRREALRGREELEPFWRNIYFQAFMRETSGRSYGNAPRGEIVSSLLQTINVLTDTSG